MKPPSWSVLIMSGTPPDSVMAVCMSAVSLSVCSGSLKFSEKKIAAPGWYSLRNPRSSSFSSVILISLSSFSAFSAVFSVLFSSSAQMRKDTHIIWPILSLRLMCSSISSIDFTCMFSSAGRQAVCYQKNAGPLYAEPAF